MWCNCNLIVTGCNVIDPCLVSSMSSTRQDTEAVYTTTQSSEQTPCILVAQDPFQWEIIHDMLDVQHYNLIEYHLAFPNNTVNPLTHNMKHIFKVSRLNPYFFAVFPPLNRNIVSNLFMLSIYLMLSISLFELSYWSLCVFLSSSSSSSSFLTWPK